MYIGPYINPKHSKQEVLYSGMLQDWEHQIGDTPGPSISFDHQFDQLSGRCAAACDASSLLLYYSQA